MATNIIVDESQTLKKYSDTMGRLIKSAFPYISNADIKKAIDYSINKRLYNASGTINNNYTGKKMQMNILEMCDYIATREPIITSYGVMFKRHGTVPNPQNRIVQEFLDLRGIHKKEMFKYPKFSEEYEKYNLLQSLDKVDTNAIYGMLGLYVSILYNANVAPSITSIGRSLISSAILCFEMFLSNNVKFSSLNDILIFIDNVRMESSQWKYNDYLVLDKDKFISQEECFYKIMITSGYKYIPTNEEMDIVWSIIRNCNQIELNRLYYKNNLYGFMDNSRVRALIPEILSRLKTPYMEPMKPPKEIIEPLNQLRDYLLEYVFYCYQIMDRMDRNKNMIKNISIISDTDSSFVSLDAWYRYCIDIVKFQDFPILHQSLDVIEYCKALEKETGEWIDPTDKRMAVTEYKVDEFGDPEDPELFSPIHFEDPELDYDFYNDEVIERNKAIDVLTFIPQDNLKFSIINIMAYILDSVINRYMIDFTKQSHSYRGDAECKIIMKNEFYMYRVLLTSVKKHYAALQGIQEGKFLGEGGVLSVTGIDNLMKSTTAESTRKALNKILIEDILSPDNIDQAKIIKHLAILEKNIYDDVQNGSKKYYKPVTVKSASHYAVPLEEQGIKGSIAWNMLKDEGLPSLDLRERNGIDIIKTNININTIEKIKDSYPEAYQRMYNLVNPYSTFQVDDWGLAKDVFKGNITSIALPKDVNVPKWLIPLIDIEAIVSDNISGFPVDSVGISKFDNKTNINFTNMIKL